VAHGAFGVEVSAVGVAGLERKALPRESEDLRDPPELLRDTGAGLGVEGGAVERDLFRAEVELVEALAEDVPPPDSQRLQQRTQSAPRAP
jgi:hypothetical protein